MTTLELLKEYLNDFFTLREPERILDLLTEDYHSYGAPSDEAVTGIEQARKIARDPAYLRFAHYTLEICEETEISEDSAVVHYTLTHKSLSLRFRLLGVSRVTPAGRKLYLLESSMVAPARQQSVFDELAEKRKNEEGRALLEVAALGGVMGGYDEPGFPFYYINKPMLRYLGYDSQEAFVGDIGGLIDNCIHPEDRAAVADSVNRQLVDKGEYTVEYRMRKRDGGYLWVHDVGRHITAEDGRTAIISACCDITAEKENARFLDGLVKHLNGSLATYIVDEEQHRTIPLYLSDSMGSHQGLARDEYTAQYGTNGMDSIYPDDREAVWESMCHTVQSDNAPSISFRVFEKDGGIRWMNASYARYGEQDGKPVILVLFTPISVQYDLQRKALNQDGTGIAVIDSETMETYFVNDAMFRLLGLPPKNYNGQKCTNVLPGCGGTCDTCGLHDLLRGGMKGGVYTVNDHWLSTDVEEQAWNGRSVVVIYAHDITEQHALQEQQESSNRELKRLLHNMSCGMCVGTIAPDKTYNVKYISEGFCKLFEGTEEELRASYEANPLRGVHPGDVPAVKAYVRDGLGGAGSREITYRYTTVKGSLLWITCKTIVIEDEKGGLVSYSTYFDVTEQMQTQEQLVDVIHNVPGGVCMYRFDGKRLTPLVVSEQALHLFGLDPAREADKRLTVSDRLIHPDDLPVLLGKVKANLFRMGEEYAHTYRIWNEQKQSYSWISAAAVCVMQDDGSVVIYVNFSDVNAAKNLEKSLREEEDMLQSACEFAHLWTWVYEIPRDRIRTSPRLQQDFGMPPVVENFPEAWLDMGFILPEYIQLHREKVQAVKNGSANEEFEVRIRHKDGSVHWSRIRFNRLSRSPELAICTAQLIDDEKILEARAAVEQQKLLGRDSSMIGYTVTDVTLDKLLVHETTLSEENRVPKGASLEEGMEVARGNLSAADWQRYHDMHDRDMLLQAFAAGKSSFTFEGQRIREDGAYLWVRCVLNLLKDPVSGDVFLYEYSYDIHSRKMLEEISFAAAKYDYVRVASVNLNDGKMTLIHLHHDEDRQDVAIWDYSAHAKAYGSAVVLAEDRANFLHCIALRQVLKELADKDSYEFVFRIHGEDGTIQWRRTRFSYYNRAMGICLMTRADVTQFMREEEQKNRRLQGALLQAQDALLAKEKSDADREQLCMALFNIVPMVISNNLTRNTYVMLNYEHFTTKKAAYGGNYDELIRVGASTVPEDQRALFAETFGRENLIRAYEKGEKSVTLEHRQVGDDGIVRWIETRVIFVRRTPESDLCTITMSQDITPRREQTEALQKAMEAAEAATMAKSEFLSRMSHEIRTPMNAIMGMTAIAKENRADFVQVDECLNKIDMSSHFLLTLINDILEMSRIESGRTELKHIEFGFDFLIESIRTVVEPLALKSSLRYEFLNNAKTDSHYQGDPTRIQQVLVNLIGNAIKFTKPGGKVRFSVNIDSETAHRTNFRFTVADTGIGMSKAFMEKMFTPFTQEDGSNTSEYGGSGLGLAISKSLVEAMGGAISAESIPKVGSTFTVTLPLDRLDYAVKETAAPAENEAPDFSVLKDKNVLMAEDHPLNVMVATKLLTRRGIQVVVAENGQVAVDKFKASPPDYYDAILMDIRMPVMDGLDATRTIRALDRPDAKTIPIIAMTANALDEDRRRSKEAGMNAHLAKPFEPIRLYATLAREIKHAEGDASL